MEQRENKEAKHLGMSRGTHRKVRETLGQAVPHHCSPGCLCRPGQPGWSGASAPQHGAHRSPLAAGALTGGGTREGCSLSGLSPHFLMSIKPSPAVSSSFLSRFFHRPLSVLEVKPGLDPL